MYLIFVTGASILSVEKFLIKGENCTFCVEKNLDNVFACEENYNYEACNAIFFKHIHLLILNNQLNLLNPICPLCHDIKAVKIFKLFKFLML